MNPNAVTRQGIENQYLVSFSRDQTRKKVSKKVSMIDLPNRCSMSEPSINKTGDWYIQFWFYDKAHPSRQKKFIVIKKGFKGKKTTKEKLSHASKVISAQISQLAKGFNPIRGERVVIKDELQSETSWLAALELAIEKKQMQDHTRECYDSMMTNIKRAAGALGINCTISELKRRDIVECLNYLQNNPNLTIKGKRIQFGNPSYNRYKSYLQSLFGKLIEIEVIESNPARDIKKLPEIKKARQLLTENEIEKINDYLFKNNYNFWRYMHIFYQSGARSTEMLRIKTEDVDLKKREFKTTILKAGGKEEIRAITLEVFDLWSEIFSEANPGDYIFSEDLKPGTVKMKGGAIPERWEKNVQARFGIKPTFYSLKHLFATRVKKMKGKQFTAMHLAHASGNMLDTIYDTDAQRQVLEEGKELRITL